MRTLLAACTVLAALATPALAEGDAAKGEKEFKKCKSCHMIKDGDETLVKGGRTGPNLFGVVGRQAGSTDFKYSDAMIAKGEEGHVWDEASIAEFTMDPSGYLGGRSKMTFKLKKGNEDVTAYLATFGAAE